jgi:Cu-Zn family superoxide dismutase
MNLSRLVIILSAFFIASCNNSDTNTTTSETDSAAATTETTSQANTTAEAVLSGTQADTTLSGTVRFTENNGQVKMTLDVQIPKMANKTVAVHIHEHGSCGDMGKEAHGHWNPTNANHGKWGSGSFHLGDIGNVDLNGEGKGTLEMETDLWSISGSDSTKNILNRAIIVHGGKDDFTTQPTGNAGSRIGCGVIQTSH